MKPGKPLVFAEINPKSDESTMDHKILVFGLPGNPVSCIVCFNLFVLPAIRRLAGWANPHLLRFLNLKLSSHLLSIPYFLQAASCF